MRVVRHNQLCIDGSLIGAGSDRRRADRLTYSIDKWKGHMGIFSQHDVGPFFQGPVLVWIVEIPTCHAV